MTRRNRLELTWIGKDERPRLEPRILLEDTAVSYHAKARGPHDVFDNKLILGDNLLALKALEQGYAGRVKCVFIDPPYNTGSAFEHYDDGLEHSLWLSLMRDRLELIRRLLAADGSLWITIDDNEAHYLKVLCDEVFGRANFVANVVWQKKYSKQNDSKHLSVSHDHILVFAKEKALFKPNHIQRTPDQLKGYSNPDNDPRGPWTSVVYTCAKTRNERPNLFYEIRNPTTGRSILPDETRVWGYDIERHRQHEAEKRLWWGKRGELEKPRLKVFLAEVGEGVVPDTLWTRDEVGDNQDAKREAIAINRNDPFATPKPEKLIKRILEIATNAGDLVLDSFAGSGTTGAVAHKMGRRWIMVELGQHYQTHIVPRLTNVVDGADAGGVTQEVGWGGGGGFRCYHLAPSLIETDRYGNAVISKKYNGAQLAEAVCKHMGFTYSPSTDSHEYWKHGLSSERDFIFVTTASLTFDALKRLSEDVGSERTLLVCCRAFQGKTDSLANITVKKIPQAVLANCEWGRDDYSLRIASLPQREGNPDDPHGNSAPRDRKNGRGKGVPANQPTLFEGRGR